MTDLENTLQVVEQRLKKINELIYKREQTEDMPLVVKKVEKTPFKPKQLKDFKELSISKTDADAVLPKFPILEEIEGYHYDTAPNPSDNVNYQILGIDMHKFSGDRLERGKCIPVISYYEATGYKLVVDFVNKSDAELMMIAQKLNQARTKGIAYHNNQKQKRMSEVRSLERKKEALSFIQLSEKRMLGESIALHKQRAQEHEEQIKMITSKIATEFEIFEQLKSLREDLRRVANETLRKLNDPEKAEKHYKKQVEAERKLAEIEKKNDIEELNKKIDEAKQTLVPYFMALATYQQGLIYLKGIISNSDMDQDIREMAQHVVNKYNKYKKSIRD